MIILDNTPLLTGEVQRSVLTGLKVSSLVRTCVFCKPELTGKEGPRGTEILSFWSAKMKYINVKSSKSRWEKLLNLSSYVYFQNYGH